MDYAWDTFKLCNLSSIPLNENESIPFLINGLVSWENVEAMTAAAYVDVSSFITKIRELEQLREMARRYSHLVIVR